MSSIFIVKGENGNDTQDRFNLERSFLEYLDHSQKQSAMKCVSLIVLMCKLAETHLNLYLMQYNNPTLRNDDETKLKNSDLTRVIELSRFFLY